MGTLTVRLSAEDDALVARLARQNGSSKSEFVRDLIRARAARIQTKKSGETAYDRIKHLVGSYSSGGMNLSERTGDKFYAMLVEDRKRRDSGRRRAPRRTDRSN